MTDTYSNPLLPSNFKSGFQRGLLQRLNPEKYKRLLDEEDLQRQMLRQKDELNRNNEYINDVIGQKGNSDFNKQDFNMLDPISQELAMEDGYEAPIGLQGGQINKLEAAGRLMSAPLKGTRATGGQLLGDLMKREPVVPGKGPTGFTNIQVDPKTRRFVGYNKASGAIEFLPTKVGQIPGTEDFLYHTDKLDAEHRMKQDFQTETSQFNDIQRAYQSVATANQTGIGDIAMIFNIMKVFDPRSQITEGEAAQAKNAAGIPPWLFNLYNQVIDGRVLSPEARTDIINQASEMYNNQLSQYKKVREIYTADTMHYGLNTPSVVGPSIPMIEIKDQYSGAITDSTPLTQAEKTELAEFRRRAGVIK